MRWSLLLITTVAVSFAQSDPDFSGHARRAEAAIKANDKTTAEAELNWMLKADPGNVNAHANLGMLKYVQGDYLEAAGQFQAALANSPSLWNAQAFLGLCEARLGHTARSQTLLEASLPHLTDSTLLKQASLELARIYTDIGQIDKAVPVIDHLASVQPADPEVLYTQYRLHSEIASKALRQLTAADKDSAWAHEVYGQSYMLQEQYDSAIREFQKALELGPQLSGLHYQLGEALLLSERSESKRTAAEQQFQLELKQNPQDADCLLKLADIALERGNNEQARALLARALRVRPESAAAHVTQARILKAEGNIPSAIAELEAAEKLAPDVKTTYYQLATLYRQQGRQADADQQLQVFRRLDLAEQSRVRSADTLP
ncbi:MAG TPA: tetratricopeptide repeat protein [Bryobacteraceae bacterium]|nr:tetratricopeptide repeat protein [Bryobacteraceae bacterium]